MKRFLPVTGGLVVVSVIVTVLAYVLPDPTTRWLYATNLEVWLAWKWWALVTSAFIHAGPMHLIFNCYWIWIFGRMLEPELRTARYLGLFLATAWMGSAAEFAWSGELGVGISGVAYGFMGFLMVNRSHRPDFARGLGSGTIVFLLVSLVLCFPLTNAGVIRVANAAHLGGLATGCLLGLAAYPRRWRLPAWCATALLLLGSVVPLVWAPWQDGWQLVAAYRAVDRRDYDAALGTLENIRRQHPDHAWAAEQEASIRMQRGQYRLAKDILENAVGHSPDDSLQNTLAWLLSTCPLAEIRDGALAVDLARKACADTNWSNAAYLDTLAAAYAEVGDYDAAVKWTDQALQHSGTNEAGLIRPHLEAFRAGKPWREPLPKNR